MLQYVEFPFRWIHCAIIGSFNENPFWYQQCDPKQVKTLIGGQLTVVFDTADNCRLYITTMKALNFQDDVPSSSIDDVKNHYVLVFESTSLQNATENRQYPELVGVPLIQELSFAICLEYVTLLIHWEK